MRAITGILLGSLLALLAGCATTQTQPQIKRISPEELERIMPKPMPNLSLDEIVKLSKANTPPQQIIDKIKSTNSRYDLAPSQTLDLGKQGVSAKVLDYIYQAHEQAIRDGFAEEINKREKENQLKQEQLERDYQLRYQPFYDPFWYGYGFGPAWRYGPGFRYYRGW